MNSMLTSYAGIGVVLIIGILLPILLLGVSRTIQPRKYSKEKELSYECGLDTQGETWIRFRISYFMYALVFIAFDVETIFLFPWAVRFKSLGLFGFIEMLIFMAILLTGFWYAWKKGALEWMQ